MKCNAQEWACLRTFLRNSCGVALLEDQAYLMEARLAPVASQFSFSSITSLIQHACAMDAPPFLRQAVIDAMTTHETKFFRDASFWAQLERIIIPETLRRRTSGGIRIWCAACSTGQEPYSLAMLIVDRWPEHFARFSIIGTDISAHSIAKAQMGYYSAFECNRGLSASSIKQHFERHETGYRISQRLRQAIRFSPQNLFDNQPYPANCDVIICRNVLIYFDDQHRELAVARLNAALRPNCFIGLGSSEFWRGNNLGAGWYQPCSQATTFGEAHARTCG